MRLAVLHVELQPRPAGIVAVKCRIKKTVRSPSHVQYIWAQCVGCARNNKRARPPEGLVQAVCSGRARFVSQLLLPLSLHALQEREGDLAAILLVRHRQEGCAGTEGTLKSFPEPDNQYNT